MKRNFPHYLDVLEPVAASLWLGAVLCVLLLAAQPGSSKFIDIPLQSAGRIAEVSGLIILGLQFLGRRRYQGIQKLFVLDGIRQLLAFAALFINELYRYSIHPSQGSGAQHNITLFFGMEIVFIIIMVVVSALLHAEWMNSPRLLKN